MSVVALKAISRVTGQLTRAAVELAKLWRNDKYLRKLDVRLRTERSTSNAVKTYFWNMITICLQAVMVVADAKQSLTITGNGDVLEPHDGVIGMCCTYSTVCIIVILCLHHK